MLYHPKVHTPCCSRDPAPLWLRPAQARLSSGSGQVGLATRLHRLSCALLSFPSTARLSESQLQAVKANPIKDELEGDSLLRNRVHRRLIMVRVGKSIYDASSLVAMIIGILGGIKGQFS
jgi:hypothetical protein